MPFDLKQWLSELAASNALSPEDQKLLEEKLGKPDVVKRLEEGQLRQSDYDRKMNTLKQEHETRMREVTTLQTSLANWKKDADAQVRKLQTDLEQERITRAQYEGKIRSLAGDYGLDPNELITAAAPPAPNPPAKTDPQPPAIPEEFAALKKDFDMAKTIFPFLPAELMDLSVQHQELYGKPLGNMKQLVEKAIEEGKPVQAVWEETYKVTDRRNEVAAERKKAEELQIRQDERQKVLSEMSVPTLRPNEPRSPLFSSLPESKKPVARTEGELSAVDKAALAYEQGKYRPGA